MVPITGWGIDPSHGLGLGFLAEVGSGFWVWDSAINGGFLGHYLGPRDT